jgi:hypothetical protein
MDWSAKCRVFKMVLHGLCPGAAGKLGELMLLIKRYYFTMQVSP